jgi:glycosyltransferase involved in cell wall biosynthesis
MLSVAYQSEASPSKLQQILERQIRQHFVTKRSPAHFVNRKLVSEEYLFALSERGLVLKAPRFVAGHLVEKGALLLTHTNQFSPFLSCLDVAAILQHYVLVLEPAWAIYARANILAFACFADHPIIVMAPEKRDYQFLSRLRTNLIPVRFGWGDWINPEIFSPLAGQEKRFDAVMVAREATYKRHHVLFRALRRLKDPSLRVALVGHSSPTSPKELQTLIDMYRVGQNVHLFGKVSQQEVNVILNQSKVNILLSLWEGGNRSLFEGLFADVPALALQQNIGLCKEYFTPQTGKLIEEKELGSALLYFREHWMDFNPRSWALTHIAPEVTTAKLNALLKTLALQRGEEWTRDIVATCHAPEVQYYPDETVGTALPSLADIIVQYARSPEVRAIARSTFPAAAAHSPH